MKYSKGILSLLSLATLCAASAEAKTQRILGPDDWPGTGEFPDWPHKAEVFFSYFMRGKKKPSLKELPTARLEQPWPYRALADTSHDLEEADTYGLEAWIEHKPLPGVTPDMLKWWFGALLSKEPVVYPGDGTSKAPLYQQWHPRDHVLTELGPPPESVEGAKGPLWRIVEFFQAPEPGYTRSNYHRLKDNTVPFVDAVTELLYLDGNGMGMTLPLGWLGKYIPGKSLLHIQHAWKEGPEGLVVRSTLAVGVMHQGWRPLQFARARNAIVRALFGGGKDAVHVAKSWMHHCVEEFGNLPHLLPHHYAEQAGAAGAGAAGGGAAADGGSGAASEDAGSGEGPSVEL